MCTRARRVFLLIRGVGGHIGKWLPDISLTLTPGEVLVLQLLPVSDKPAKS